MIATISNQDFAGSIISRYTALPPGGAKPAEMLLAASPPVPDSASPLARSVRNVYLINRCINENITLNINAHLHFLSNILNRAVTEIHGSSLRQIRMLQKQMTVLSSVSRPLGGSRAPIAAKLPVQTPVSAASQIPGFLPAPLVTAQTPEAQPPAAPGRERAAAQPKPDAGKAVEKSGPADIKSEPKRAPVNVNMASAPVFTAELHKLEQSLLAMLGADNAIPAWHRTLWGSVPGSRRRAENTLSETLVRFQDIRDGFHSAMLVRMFPQQAEKAAGTAPASLFAQTGALGRLAARPLERPAETFARAPWGQTAPPAEMSLPKSGDISNATARVSAETRKLTDDPRVIVKTRSAPTRFTSAVLRKLAAERLEQPIKTPGAYPPGMIHRDAASIEAVISRNAAKVREQVSQASSKMPRHRPLPHPQQVSASSTRNSENAAAAKLLLAEPGAIALQTERLAANLRNARAAMLSAAIVHPEAMREIPGVLTGTAGAPAKITGVTPGGMPGASQSGTPGTSSPTILPAVRHMTPAAAAANTLILQSAAIRHAVPIAPIYARIAPQAVSQLAANEAAPSQAVTAPARAQELVAITKFLVPATVTGLPEMRRISFRERKPAEAKAPAAYMIHKTEPARAETPERTAKQMEPADIQFIKKTIKQHPSEPNVTVNRAINLPGEMPAPLPAAETSAIDGQINQITDKVYRALERRLRSERMRKGLL